MPLYLEFIKFYIMCITEDFMFCASMDFVLERKVFKKRLLIIFPAAALAVCSHLLIPIPVIAYTGAMLSGLVMFVWYSDLKVVSGFILYFLTFLIQSGLQATFMWIPQNIVASPFFIIPAFLLSTGIFYLMVKFLPIKKLYHCLTEQNIILKFLLFNTALLFEIHNIYYKVDSTSYYDKVPLYVAVILFAIFVNAYSILTHIKIKNQKTLLDAYNTWLPIVEQLICQIRTIQHNYDNELQTFKALPLVHTEVEDLKKAIIDYVRQIIDNNIPMEVSLEEIPNPELRQCIEELNGSIEFSNNKYTVSFN